MPIHVGRHVEGCLGLCEDPCLDVKKIRLYMNIYLSVLLILSLNLKFKACFNRMPTSMTALWAREPIQTLMASNGCDTSPQLKRTSNSLVNDLLLYRLELRWVKDNEPNKKARALHSHQRRALRLKGWRRRQGTVRCL